MNATAIDIMEDIITDLEKDNLAHQVKDVYAAINLLTGARRIDTIAVKYLINNLETIGEVYQELEEEEKHNTIVEVCSDLNKRFGACRFGE